MAVRTLDVERATGIPARFIVYYERNGKRYLDGLYDATVEEARETFLHATHELGWQVKVTSIVPRTGADIEEISGKKGER